MSENEDFLLSTLNRLARGDFNSYEAFLHTVEKEKKIDETETISYWHCIELDGNGRDRTKDFVKNIITDIIDYVIPRSRIAEAYEKYRKDSTSRNIMKLRQEAQETFVNSVNSGELGELILFVLAEKFLKLPQVICKMNLKTNHNMYFNGADGVYLGLTESNNLALHWGESKLYKDFSDAVESCLDSLNILLNANGGILSADNRDFILLKQFIDLNDKKMEDVLKEYLDRDSPKFNKVEIRAIAFVGFERDNYYPQAPNKETISDVENRILQEIPKLNKTIQDKLKMKKLDSFVIHFFCIPFKSVKVLREEFHKCLGIFPDKG